MGLFRDLGEKVERFKKQAEQASRERAPYECADCGKAIHIEREDCPDCGSEDIVQRRPPDESDQEGDDAEGSSAGATGETDTDAVDDSGTDAVDDSGTAAENSESNAVEGSETNAGTTGASDPDAEQSARSEVAGDTSNDSPDR